MTQNDESRSGARPKGRTFSFSFGKKPPTDDPELRDVFERAVEDLAGEEVSADDPRMKEFQRLMELSKRDERPDGVDVKTNTERFTLEFKDGKLQIGRGAAGAPPTYENPADNADNGANPEAAREAEMWDRLHRIAEGKGAFPDTARWHAWLSMFVWAVTIALPVAALILALATGQTQETVFFMTFGALIVAAMFRSSIR